MTDTPAAKVLRFETSFPEVLVSINDNPGLLLGEGPGFDITTIGDREKE